MANSSRRKGTRAPVALSPIHRRAAGVDIGATFHVVAVPSDLDGEPVRSFKSFTADLNRLADWLVGLGITTVAMESTGIYWVPVFEILEARGLEVLLVNARDARNVPGRKTDVNDAQWLQQLHSYGLLRASFRPEAAIVTLRAYLRHRERLVEYAAAHVQHMQKAMMQMNLQLHHVVTDITGVTGMTILRAIVAGERDPAALAEHRDARCKASVETIREALTLLRLAAVAVSRTSSALGAFFRRIAVKAGKPKAVTATARKIAVLFYNTLRYGKAYVDPGADYYEQRYRKRTIESLRRRADALGFSLVEVAARGGAS